MKKFLAVAVVVIGALTYGALQLEFVQKFLFDKKADFLGTDRTVTFYAKMTGEKVASFSDRDTRINLENNRVLSVWQGQKKRKIMSNMDFIIIDNKTKKQIKIK